MDNNESTGNIEYQNWVKSLANKSDYEISHELYNRILTYGNLDSESQELFTLGYEYCMKLIQQGKPLEPNLLKIYLQDIKGKDINHINVMNLFALLGMCGINFENIPK